MMDFDVRTNAGMRFCFYLRLAVYLKIYDIIEALSVIRANNELFTLLNVEHRPIKMLFMLIGPLIFSVSIDSHAGSRVVRNEPY